MKKMILIAILFISAMTFAQNYQGVQNCQMCHSVPLRDFPGLPAWQSTLHAKIHEVPTTNNVKGDLTQTVSMGSAYGNATATFRSDANGFYVILNPVGGTPVEHKIVYTYGGGWKQRFLVKIENSYYMPPVQWNLKGYLDNSTGSWAAYNPQNWFTSTGALKPLDNAFRKKSWDKNCAGCHVVPGNKTNTVQTVVTGSDTAWVYGWANSSSAANIVVGCESCHGHPSAMAGAGHVNNLKTLTYDRKLEVCGQCHFRGFSSNRTYEYPMKESTMETYQPGNDLSEYIQIQPGLWPDGVTSKQHHQQWNDYKYSKHFNPSMGMTCVTCHDPHQNTANKHQLKEDFNALTAGVGCAKCHGDKIAATNGINNHTKHPQAISACANCHMTQNAVTSRAYDISNHSFNVIRPNATLNFSTSTGGMINTCAVACHRNGQGTRGAGPSFGVTDASLTTWNETTDLALADTLWRYYQVMYGVVGIEETGNEMPSSFALEQNYPNPFNPSTTIQFSVAARGDIRVEIYAIDGTLVEILVNKELEAGVYKAQWNGRTAYGSDVSSGIYIYRLVNNNNPIVSKKMVLMR